MPTEQGSTIGIFIVLTISYLIAWWSVRKYRHRFAHEHLFGGNTAVLGLSSNVGSIISMAVAFTALLSGGFVFGWQILISIAAGGATGLALLLKFSGRSDILESREESSAVDHRWGTSYLALLADERPKSFLSVYGVMIGFYVAMLATELAVLRGLLRFFIPLPTLELTLLLSVILIVCCSYVFLGGFRGVLMTDYFQLLVVIALLAATAQILFARRAALSLPSMTAAAIRWTPTTLVLLHTGVFIGAFGWAFANVDQWNRTVGTLPRPSGERTLKWSAAITFAVAVVPVLIGSSALLSGLSPVVGNAASLFLLRMLWTSGNTTFRLLFVMALTCAALTTLNTYIISLHQLYYEYSIRMNVVETARQEKLRVLTSWKENRVVVLLGVAVAYIASFGITEHSVYAIGVASLCGYLFIAPVFLRAVLSRDVRHERRFNDAGTVLMTLVLSPLIGVVLDRIVGPVDIHLYLIPIAIAAAAILAAASTSFARRGVRSWKK